MSVTLKTNLIDVDEQQLIFHLHNEQISYILGVETGNVLAHLYFGPRVRAYHGERRYPRIDRGFSGNLPDTLDRTYSRFLKLRILLNQVVNWSGNALEANVLCTLIKSCESKV